VRPDTVCVELDAMRYEALTDDSRWRKLDIFTVIKERKVLFLMSSLALQAYQRRLGEKLGVRPGAELLAAVDAAKEIGAEVVLADREIQATLKRTWASLGFVGKIKVLSMLIGGFFAAQKITEEQIEELKDRDNISEMMTEFARVMPKAKVPLIDERDAYLISKIREAPGPRIVAVVGAGHVAGMIANLEAPVDREELSKIPGPSLTGTILKWVIPAIVLGAFYYGYTEHSAGGLEQMLYAWILPNSIVAGIFAIVAGARPLTVVVSIVASPITSLNPTIGAGMVAGVVEAWLRRPTVEDCEQVNEAAMSYRGLYKNRFTRVLVVAVLVTLGSAIGGWIGATWVVTLI
jgi:pheromone shutdown-related protein TraB